MQRDVVAGLHGGDGGGRGRRTLKIGPDRTGLANGSIDVVCVQRVRDCCSVYMQQSWQYSSVVGKHNLGITDKKDKKDTLGASRTRS